MRKISLSNFTHLNKIKWRIFIPVQKAWYVKKIARGGWSGFGKALTWDPSQMITCHPKKIPKFLLKGGVVQFCQILSAHITLPRKHDLKQQQSRANNTGGLTWGMVQRWKINGRTSWFVSSSPGWSSWSTPPNVLLRAHPPSFHPHTKSTENCSDHSETLMPKLMKLAEI